MECWWNGTDREKTKMSEKKLSNSTLRHNLTQTGLGSNPWHRSSSPATACLICEWPWKTEIDLYYTWKRHFIPRSKHNACQLQNLEWRYWIISGDFWCYNSWILRVQRLGYDFITQCIKFILFGQTMTHTRNSNFKSTRFVHTHTHIYLIGYNTNTQSDE
jgi:hypothetical protein